MWTLYVPPSIILPSGPPSPQIEWIEDMQFCRINLLNLKTHPVQEGTEFNHKKRP